MNGNETVKYLKGKYQEGEDYGHIMIVVKRKEVQVWHVVPTMAEELQKLGFVEQGYMWSKSWDQKPQTLGGRELSTGWTARESKINWDVEDYNPAGCE